MSDIPTAPNDDFLEGVEDIKQYLGLKTSRQVYFRREKGWPIRNIPGAGLVSSKSELDRHRRATDTLIKLQTGHRQRNNQ